MPFTLTEKDLALLDTVHPDLKRVFVRAAAMSPFRFRVTEGVRTLERQRTLVAAGASSTMNSRHLTGHAADVVPYLDFDHDGDIDGDDLYAWPLYYRLAPIIKEAAKIEGVKIEWGGDWKSPKDGPHWQLPWKAYPVNGVPADRKPVTDREVAAIGVGATSATATFAHDPLNAVLDVVSGQQAALSSGDVTKTVIAALIVAGAAFYLWWRTRE